MHTVLMYSFSVLDWIVLYGVLLYVILIYNYSFVWAFSVCCIDVQTECVFNMFSCLLYFCTNTLYWTGSVFCMVLDVC